MGQRWLKNSIEEKQTNETLKRKEKKEMQKETNKKNYNQFFNCSVRWQFPNIKTNKTKGISPLQKEIYFTKFPAFCTS